MEMTFFESSNLRILKIRTDEILEPVEYIRKTGLDYSTNKRTESSVFQPGVYSCLVLLYNDGIKSDTFDVLMDHPCAIGGSRYSCKCNNVILTSVKFNGIEHFGIGKSLLFQK